MAEDEGWELYNFICKEKPSSILELGHAHGASTIYMAAALDEIGSGVIETVDLSAAQDRDPNLEKLTLDSGLNEFINIFREKNSYTWFLKKKIENCTSGHICEPIYDFCFIDGPKNWTIDGLAFFLVSKLLLKYFFVEEGTFSNNFLEVFSGINKSIRFKPLTL